MDNGIDIRIDSVISESGFKNVEIGNKLGVSGSYIGRVRSGVATPSDAFIISFCRFMGVNEEWLRTGSGNMRPDVSLEEEIGMMLAQVMANKPTAEREDIARALVRMGPAGWESLLDFLTEFRKSIAKAENYSASKLDTE